VSTTCSIQKTQTQTQSQSHNEERRTKRTNTANTTKGKRKKESYDDHFLQVAAPIEIHKIFALKYKTMSASSTTLSRIRQRPVLFGNPALGTYKGDVFTLESCTDAEQHTTIAEIPDSSDEVDRMVAMIDVPPEQVPEGILNLARSHRNWILHVRIVIAESNEEDAEDEKSDEKTYLVLFQMTTRDAAGSFLSDLDGRPYTFLDETVTCSVKPVVALKGHDGVSLLNPMFAPTTSQKNKTKSNSNVTEDFNCAVCLELMHNKEQQQQQTCSSIFTTVCNHKFHLDCMLQCQDSPCPVCRYDHSGLNEALSQCHICGTTESNYVCLICGVVSCVGTFHGDGTESRDTASNNNNDARAHHFHTSHAGQHYEETLHAYALDTQTQHVWDFAGQGYVHRLLQNKQDGKLVEISDPYTTASLERNQSPGLSDTQEGEVVHRKLEGFASQYYTLLKSQLEQQRIFYDGRLQEIRNDFGKSAALQIKQGNDDHLSALKQERKQLQQSLLSIQKKHSKVQEDVIFLKSMNESLEANKPQLELKIKQAQQERFESREMIQKYLPALKEKVTKLMLQLEEQDQECVITK
jgi:BRCA1-associated protein